MEIMVGTKNMRWLPVKYEEEYLKIDRGMEREKHGDGQKVFAQ